MSGYVVKITLENTHPPVWRRLIIPERIYFWELHQMIQIAFGWENEHLHDFTFPDRSLCVAEPDGEDEWRDILPEDKTMVDDFLLSYPWIRYTYDFGDNWCHRIVFEKEDSTYEERYGKVLKVKGENFEEDSGGVWGGAALESPYDIEAVNKDLQKLICPTAELDQETGDYMQEFQQVMEELKDLYALTQEVHAQSMKGMSELDKIINNWDDFCQKKEFLEKLQIIQEQGETIPKEDIEMKSNVATMLEELKQLIDINENGYYFEKVVSDQTCADILAKANLKELRDYCKYLQVSWKKNWTKKKLAQTIIQNFHEHPKYLLYIFDEEEFEIILDFCKEPIGCLFDIEDIEPISKGIAIGLMEVQIVCTKEGEFAYLEITKEAEEMLLGLSEINWQFFYERLFEINEKIRGFIQAYGIIEMDKFYQMFCEAYEIPIEQEEFQRIIYWHFRMNGFVKTGELSLTKEKYVSYIELDIERVLEELFTYAKDIDYRKISKKELEQWQENGIDEIYPCWNSFAEFIYHISELEDICADLIEYAFLCVLDGYTVTELAEDILENVDMYGILEETEFWKIIMDVSIYTALPMLKGHSRKEYIKLTGKQIYDVALFDLDALEEHVEKDTHLYEMPAEIQYHLYEAYSESGSDNSIKKIKQILEDTGNNNLEIQMLLVNCYISRKEFSKARKLLLELKMGLIQEDSSIDAVLDFIKNAQKIQRSGGNFLDMFDEFDKGFDNFDEIQVPYRRENVKIGRNDPCPCGSGKKYKHCCGKNKQ